MNSMLKGGDSMSYQSTLILQLTRRLEIKKRKNKIMRIWNTLIPVL
jgi:hypothetical protein